ncbi:hypothetical protein [Borrelia crocidurae]|nr:hypothetical protein [Borrelia crocidurae]
MICCDCDDTIEISSYYEGSFLKEFLLMLMTFLISFCTFGLTFPWVYSLFCKCVAKNILLLSGDCGSIHKLKFTGKGIHIAKNWLFWLFFCCITFGTYIFWIYFYLKKWQTAHTHLESSPVNNRISYYKGSLLKEFLLILMIFLISFCTFGLAFPWVYGLYCKYITEHTIIDGYTLNFEFKEKISIFLLMFLTYCIFWIVNNPFIIGIYIFWLFFRLKKWRIRCTYLL